MFLNTQTDFCNALPVEIASMIHPSHAGLSGLVAGTKVETSAGWRVAEDLAQGDAVYTRDGGLQVIERVTHRPLCAERMLLVPGGVFGNCSDMYLLPSQHVLVENDLAERAFGNPLVMVLAEALAGYRGISWTSAGAGADQPTIQIELGFAQEEVVFANSGVLLLCAGMQTEASEQSFYKSLSVEQGQLMVALMSHNSPLDLAA